MRRKVMRLMLFAGIMSLLNSVSVYATEEQGVPEKVQEIANGSDDIYGEGAPIEHIDNPNARFQSGETDHTHQYIVANAFIILSNDYGDSIFNDSLNAAVLMEATDWPD